MTPFRSRQLWLGLEWRLSWKTIPITREDPVYCVFNGTIPISPSMFFGDWRRALPTLQQSLRDIALTPIAGWTIS